MDKSAFVLDTIRFFPLEGEFDSVWLTADKLGVIKQIKWLKPVLWIRMGFNADPDPDTAFNADLDRGSGCRFWSDFKVIKV
jgi:hypothetical protein